ATADAVARARAGEGPTLIEALTYRWFGHYAGDNAAYRDEGEVTEWRARDAIVGARAALDPVLADDLDASVEREIEAALAFALDSPISGPDVLALDHYATA